MQSEATYLQRIEEAALNAWPALNTLLYDGWVLRLANGYTKRANSVTPIYPGNFELAEKINFCERIFYDRHLPPIFRLTSISEERGLDEELERRNYQRIDPTLVQTVLIDQTSSNFSNGIAILHGKQGIESWLNIFHQLNHYRQDARTHEKMLHNIIGQTAAVILTIKENVVACGLGVLEGSFMGLFDIVTAKEERRKGYATVLTESLLAWGQKRGARYAYLQVMEDNEAAKSLYSRLGFQTAYRYWYRIAPQI